MIDAPAPVGSLLIAPSWVGDAVMSAPLVAALHARYAEPIDVFAPAWCQPLYQRIRHVREVIENPFGHGSLRLGERYRLAQSLRARRYARAIVLPGSLKSALIPAFARIPERIGYVGEQRYFWLTEARKLDAAAHPQLVARYLALVDAPKTNPTLTRDPASEAQARAKFALDPSARHLALCPGAEYGPAKRWPAAHFAAVAREAERQGTQVWLLGSAKDQEVARAVQAQAPSARNLCGQTSLGEVIDLIAQMHAVVANDSGLMHVAAAFDVPLVALYGSSTAAYTPPLSSQAQVLSLGLACSPCFKRECPLGHFDCLQKLPPERVIQALRIHQSAPT